MAKHYIRLDGIFIKKTFTTDFDKHPLETDICINENGGRHFNLEIYNNEGLPNWKYVDGKILPTTEEDLQPLIEAREAKAAQEAIMNPSDAERLDDHELAILELGGII